MGEGEEEWAAELWFEFAGASLLWLGAADGGGFDRFQFDEHLPHEPGEEPHELTALPPFSEVVGTPLQAVEVVPERDDPLGHPVGMCLRFAGGDVWVMGDNGETYVYDRPPVWFWGDLQRLELEM